MIATLLVLLRTVGSEGLACDTGTYSNLLVKGGVLWLIVGKD